MLTDASSIVLSLVAISFASRPANPRKTFGYYRLETLAALLNGLALIAISLGLAYEAIERLRTPVAVDVHVMFWVALAGMAANGLGVLVLSGSHNLNTRGVWLHLLGDLLASLGVLVAAGIMWKTEWWLADPIISIVVSVIIAYGAIGLLRETVDVLLESTPAHLDTDEIAQAVRGVADVQDMHDLHVWTLATNLYALSAHVVIARGKCAESDEILRRVKAALSERFHIDHTTLQIESDAYAHHGEPSTDVDKTA
jgi:cobalt-zinc-cadmium efflux system protein